jgi:hypothetical protein
MRHFPRLNRAAGKTARSDRSRPATVGLLSHPQRPAASVRRAVCGSCPCAPAAARYRPAPARALVADLKPHLWHLQQPPLRQRKVQRPPQRRATLRRQRDVDIHCRVERPAASLFLGSRHPRHGATASRRSAWARSQRMNLTGRASGIRRARGSGDAHGGRSGTAAPPCRSGTRGGLARHRPPPSSPSASRPVEAAAPDLAS